MYHILLQHFRRSSAYAHRTPRACAAARVLARATHAPCCSNPTLPHCVENATHSKTTDAAFTTQTTVRYPTTNYNRLHRAITKKIKITTTSRRHRRRVGIRRYLTTIYIRRILLHASVLGIALRKPYIWEFQKRKIGSTALTYVG